VAAIAALVACAIGCATAPQPVTKIVGGKVIVTRSVSPEAYEHVTRSLLYEEEERWEDAAAELQRALPFDDEAPELRARLAELFVRLGRLDDAREQVERSLAIQPTVDGYVASAHVDQARHHDGAALEALRNAVGLALADDDADAVERTHLELADAQVVALDVAAATDTARQLVQSAPETRRGRLELASLAWALGRTDEAAQALRQVLEAEPEDIETRVQLAELEVAAGHIPAGKAAFQETMARADAPLEVAAGFAGWLTLRGDTKEALEIADRMSGDAVDADSLAQASTLERAVKRADRALAFAERAQKAGLAPGRAALLAGQALAVAGAGERARDHGQAVARFLAVPRDAPEYVDARGAAADLLRDDGKLDEAARILDQALADPPDARAASALTIARSMVDEKRGDAVRASRRLDEALAKSPDDVRLALAQAGILERAGEWQRATAIAEKLLARDPRNVEALNFAGFVAVDHGIDLPRATRRLQAAVALSPASGGIIDSLGWAYFKGGDLVRAADFLEQAGRLEPGDPEILEHLGDLYSGRQQRALALETYRRALGLSPPDRLARELAERVRTLEAKSAAGR
jgi:tetratricopeptide (TPR) repeat protein